MMMMMMIMKKSRLSGVLLLLLLLLFIGAVSGLGSVVQRYYHYINSHRTWSDAQQHCRSSYVDLATIFEQSDENQITMTHFHAWIGLHKRTSGDGSASWGWADGESYGYNFTYFWQAGQPHSSHECATAYYDSNNDVFYGQHCGAYFFFYCQYERSDHRFAFLPLSKTWSEAQDYCRKHCDELVCFRTPHEVYHLIHHRSFPVWIGLHREGETLRWSKGQSDYRRWGNDEPRDTGDCVSIDSWSKTMATQVCSARFPYVCFSHNLILVKENKTWEEALEHCRARNHELLSVQPEDLDLAMDKVMEAETEEVWTGLRFLGVEWLWVNGATLSSSDLPPCPLENQRCGALCKNGNGSVEALDCTKRRNFLCYS